MLIGGEAISEYFFFLTTKHMRKQLPEKNIYVNLFGECWPSFAKFLILILIRLSVIKREDFSSLCSQLFFPSAIGIADLSKSETLFINIKYRTIQLLILHNAVYMCNEPLFIIELELDFLDILAK